MSKPTNRLLDNWVDGFMDYTSVITSPRIFLTWAAYSAIAGALERRTWIAIAGQKLYPNTMVLLLSPPGVGKSNAIKEVHALWSKTGGFNVAPNGMTKAAFIDQLLDKIRSFSYDGREYMTHPLLIAVTEFGTLLPKYDTEFLNVINNIYDCEEIPFADRTRKGGLITVDRAHLSLIAGTQPSYLGEILPESAYGMGFMARMIMVYAGEKPKKKLFGKSAEKDEKLAISLRKDMKSISKLVGPFEVEEAAQDFIEDWDENIERDAPTHPKLHNYIPRRVMHSCKLAMSVSAARTDEMVITLDDFLKAKDLLLEAEALMPEIFKEMVTSQDASELEEIHRFLFTFCNRMGVESVPEHDFQHYISKKVPVNKIDYFIKTLISSGMVECGGLNLTGKRTYKPLPKTIFTD